MAFLQKVNTKPEEWLKNEVSWQLGKIIDALNAAHTMPFQCSWLERDLGRNYLEILKEIESLLLMVWSQLGTINISKIENHVLVWYGRQKRSQKNILSAFYRHQEHLIEWSSSPKVKLYGLSGLWSDYLLFMMSVEKNHLTKASSGKISMPTEELEKIATLFLRKMQMIYIAEPHEICIDFFTLISTFTQENVSLSHHANDAKQTKFSTFNKFRSELTKTNQWSSLSKMYLDVLNEITRGNNDNQE
tara:strand:+ start:1686 stop:2423 length:738 start_codon:yes stop_codon:yes gene_type:complete